MFLLSDFRLLQLENGGPLGDGGFVLHGECLYLNVEKFLVGSVIENNLMKMCFYFR